MDPDPERLRRAVKTGEGVHTLAVPFSQGPWVGPGDNPKPGVDMILFDDPASNPNVGVPEYDQLMSFLLRHRLVFHNGKFDLEKLRYAPIGWGGDGVELLENTVWDTQVVCPVLWPFSHVSSLKPTAARLWGEDETAEAEALKPYLGPKDNPRYDLVPWEVIGPYAAKDANLTIRLFYHQMALLGQWGHWQSKDSKVYLQCLREVEVMKVLYRMERAGVPYDAEGSKRAGDALTMEVARLDSELPFKPTTQGAATWFFGPYGAKLQPYSYTEGGKPQLTAQVVDRIIEDHGGTGVGRVASLWKRRAKLNHAASSWYLPWAEMVARDGRLRTCFRQVTRGRGTEEGGTASGRFSVERANLQAIPHDYRLVAEGGWPVESPRALIGRAAARLDGWEAWEFDLAQAELRVAAAWSRCVPMLDAITNGRDLHGETTRELFGREPGDPDWDFYRTLGKRGNFTLCFGAGGETFAGMVAKETGRYLSRGEAKTIVESWNALYPQFRLAIEYWEEYAQDRGFVPLASEDGFASGRVRVFRDGEDTHKAFNQIVQASLAEFMKVWLVEVQREMDRMGFGFVPGVGWTGLVLTIHDSLVGLFPEGDRGEEAARRVTGVASRVWDRFFGRPDPLGRVLPVPGFAEGKRWSG